MRFPLVVPRGLPPRAPVEPAAFFELAQLAFARAAQAAGGAVDRNYRLGGYNLRLSFAGPALLPVVAPALKHLTRDFSGSPNLTICLWETATTGVPAPPPAWDYDNFGADGLIRSFTTEDLFTFFQLGANALSLVDTRRNLALFWVKTADQIPYWDIGSPLRAILSLWLNRRGRLVVHAGAVGLPDGGVLLAGAGGSGKSNTALSTLTSELRYAGDDYALLSLDPAPAVFSLYCTGKTHAADTGRLPFLEPSISNRSHLARQKALYFLDQHWRHKLIDQFPLRAILLPHVTGRRDSLLRPAGAAAGLNAMAPSTFDLLPALDRSDFQMLVNLFRQLPCYHLDLGTDPAQPAQLILQLLRSGQSGPPLARPPESAPA